MRDREEWFWETRASRVISRTVVHYASDLELVYKWLGRGVNMPNIYLFKPYQTLDFVNLEYETLGFQLDIPCLVPLQGLYLLVTLAGRCFNSLSTKKELDRNLSPNPKQKHILLTGFSSNSLSRLCTAFPHSPWQFNLLTDLRGDMRATNLLQTST